MGRGSRYESRLVQAPKPQRLADRHVAKIIEAARRLYVDDGTIEDGLTAVIIAAEREFGCRVLVRTPCHFTIDGSAFTWPLDD